MKKLSQEQEKAIQENLNKLPCVIKCMVCGTKFHLDPKTDTPARCSSCNKGEDNGTYNKGS